MFADWLAERGHPLEPTCRRRADRLKLLRPGKGIRDRRREFHRRWGAAADEQLAGDTPADRWLAWEDFELEGYFAEGRAQAALLRDVFGNPFRPVTAEPCWRTITSVALATVIYAERAFDRLPILADALEDAGCDDPGLLAHLRGDGPHVCGCWAVDLVLGMQ